MSDGEKPDWRAANRARWDEAVGVHLAPGGYDLSDLRAGQGRLNWIEEDELGDVRGLRVLHLQCHFGRDTLTLAQRGAEVVGLDFSSAAIAAARALADDLGLGGRARFVEADLYDAPAAVAEPAAFDRVFVTWGAINWLPDIAEWARIVAHFLKPGGFLYLAEQHPAAFVFDDTAALPSGLPGYFVPYFSTEPLTFDNPRDYANPDATLLHATEHGWIHPLGSILSSLIDAGLALEYFKEHPSVTWRMFDCLVEDGRGGYRWPDKPWLPLAFSLKARKYSSKA
ncbi:MAG: class I SAM-dependent methyltransferase [Alphaproteobacteria bacterium]|nr:class I SAM-dependent methyltransferase [Alphaproteobacteria bacterium]